ncbi:MAG: NUDIX domain-containing protein [Candidatus Poseidoniaceae archaeon]|nr:NUDIX domain-containing protein [Candidatus Poseidoniaceae archaeon]
MVNFGSILLLQYPQGHWDFPKGHVEESDSDKKMTAARELKEETGISNIEFVDGFETKSKYNFRHKGKFVEKQVYWFICVTETMKIKLSHEHREHLWLEWPAALEQLTHKESKKVLATAWEYMKSIGKD